MSVKDFFLTELPTIIADMKKALGDRAPKISYDVEFEIEGEGMYSVQVKAGDAVVRRGGAASPIAALQFAKPTWDEALEKIVRPRLAQAANSDLAKAQGEAQKEMLRQLGGRKPAAADVMLKAVQSLPMRVVLNVEGSEHKFELRLAGAEEDDPTVTVTLAQADLEAVVGGKITAQDAFKQGKIKMKGSVTTAMALLSRLFVVA